MDSLFILLNLENCEMVFRSKDSDHNEGGEVLCLIKNQIEL